VSRKLIVNASSQSCSKSHCTSEESHAHCTSCSRTMAGACYNEGESQTHGCLYGDQSGSSMRMRMYDEQQSLECEVLTQGPPNLSTAVFAGQHYMHTSALFMHTCNTSRAPSVQPPLPGPLLHALNSDPLCSCKPPTLLSTSRTCSCSGN